jgi:hypothetical protein
VVPAVTEKGELYAYLKTRKGEDRVDSALGDRNTCTFVNHSFSGAGLHVITQSDRVDTFAMKKVTMKTEQLNQLLYEALETEMGGVQV